MKCTLFFKLDGNITEILRKLDGNITELVWKMEIVENIRGNCAEL